MTIAKLYKYTLTFLITMIMGMFSALAEDFVVVIDAGHGGKDVGAVDNNIKEKDVNLAVALKLGELIKKNLKDIKVVYTRDKDTYLTLQQRAEKANKAKGDLFISIHTNSVDKKNKNRKTVSGASTYTLGLHKGSENMEVARRENSVMKLEADYATNYQGFDPNSDESYIIFEMAQSENLSRSIKFADEVQRQMSKVAGRKDRGVHQAGFWVLWATSMPSVLVELDFICNPISAKYISSTSGQKKLAEALFNSVKSYYKSQPSNVAFSSKDNNKTADFSEDAIIGSSNAKKKKEKAISKTSNYQNDNLTSNRRRRSKSSREASANQVYDEVNLPQDKKLNDETIHDVEDKDKSAPDYKYSDSDKNVEKNKNKKTTATKNSNKSHDDDNKSVVRLNKKTTIYKIQILASKEQLKENDSRFCGFEPISCMEENGLYKYTYGETESRKEIDKLLKKVKQRIPDAFIIQIRKGVKTIIK